MKPLRHILILNLAKTCVITMKTNLCILTILAAMTVGAHGADTADLAGDWKFRRDDHQAGVREKWFAAPLAGDTTIKLPGTMDDAKLGLPNPVKPSLADLWRPNVYEGQAWYQREIEIPASWHGRRVTLFLERCRWVTQAWLDGQPCGEPQDSLIAPHVHLLGTDLQPGKHTLTLLVDNTKKIDLGTFVSALYGGTQGNLNGIVGQIELRATPPVWIDDVQVYPDWRTKSARVRVSIGNATGQAGAGAITLQALKSVLATNISWTADGGLADYQIALSDAPAWDEFHPTLCPLSVELNGDSATSRQVVFGLRELARRGTQFTMNGRPLFLRGTLECQVFPLTGYPPCDVAAWRRIFQIEKSYGLNFIRFHSWCPPEAAFAAADLEGIMIQAEAPQANVQAGSDPERDAFTEAELHADGPHLRQPSLVLPDDARQRIRRQERSAHPLGGHAHPGRPAASLFLRLRRADHHQPPVDGRHVWPRRPWSRHRCMTFARPSRARPSRPSATKSGSGCLSRILTR